MRYSYNFAHYFSRSLCTLFFATLSLAAVTLTHAETTTVSVKNYMFDPVTITVNAGSKVTWVNQDDDPHTIKSVTPDETLKSPALDTNDKFSFTFTKPGVYKYFCKLHPHMQGEIVVR